MPHNSSETNQPDMLELKLGHDSGQTTVEYALVLVFVIGVAIAAFATLQPTLLSFFTNAATQLAGVGAGV